MKCIFRVDGSLEIGSGHLVRCCNLAKALKNKGYEILFLTQKLSGDLFDIIQNNTFNFKILNEALEPNEVLTWQEDAQNSLKYIQANDILVLDHYGLDQKWEELIFLSVKALIVIDDLANRSHRCHVLIDSNYYLKQNRYKNLINSEALQLLGPNYSILNEEFKPYSRSLEKLNQKPKHILIFFGGNDQFNLNLKTINFIENKWPLEFSYLSVVGNKSVFNNELLKLKKSLGLRYELHIQTSKMSELMDTADIYVGSGGTVTWERAVKSLPSIVIAVAENQVQAALDLDQINVISYAGDYSKITDQLWPLFYSQMNELIENPKKRIEFASNSFNLSDGCGVERIITTINDLCLN